MDKAIYTVLAAGGAYIAWHVFAWHQVGFRVVGL